MVANVASVALSGLFASGKRIEVAAHNVANVSTPDYKAADVQQTSLNPGVKAKVVPTDNPVSLDEQLVNTTVASYDFKANLKVIQAQLNLDKSLFDIQA